MSIFSLSVDDYVKRSTRAISVLSDTVSELAQINDSMLESKKKTLAKIEEKTAEVAYIDATVNKNKKIMSNIEKLFN